MAITESQTPCGSLDYLVHVQEHLAEIDLSNLEQGPAYIMCHIDTRELKVLQLETEILSLPPDWVALAGFNYRDSFDLEEFLAKVVKSKISFTVDQLWSKGPGLAVLDLIQGAGEYPSNLRKRFPTQGLYVLDREVVAALTVTYVSMLNRSTEDLGQFAWRQIFFDDINQGNKSLIMVGAWRNDIRTNDDYWRSADYVGRMSAEPYNKILNNRKAWEYYQARKTSYKSKRFARFFSNLSGETD